MGNKFLYSDVWPLLVEEDQEVISDRFKKELSRADELRISVAYFAKDSLSELDSLVRTKKIKRVSLIFGMYDKDNFPKNSCKSVLEINEQWQKDGIGEIRITKNLKYHGKKYCFLKNNQIFSAITGSPNLSFAHHRKYPQYEEGVLFDDPETLKDTLDHFNKLWDPRVSENIAKMIRKFWPEVANSLEKEIEKISKINP